MIFSLTFSLILFKFVSSLSDLIVLSIIFPRVLFIMPEVAIALIVSILTVAIVFARFNLLIFNKYFCNSPFNPGFLISLINSSRNCSTS